MQLAGLMIEYLVIGSTALVPLLVLAFSFGLVEPLRQVPTAVAAALVPALYSLGMIVDSIGRFFVNKHRIEREIQEEEAARAKEGGKIRSQQVHVDALASSPTELARQLEFRSSRDRVARGVHASVMLTSVAVVISLDRSLGFFPAAIGLGVGCVACVGSYRMWRRFQRLTARYEVFVDRALRSQKTR